MADFRYDKPELLPTASTVKEPVVDQSGSALLSGIAQGVAGFFSALPTGADRARQAQDGVIGQYGRELSKISSGVQQGIYTPAMGRTKARDLYASYIGNNPGMTKDLATFHKSFMSTAGLGKVVADESPVEEADKDLLKTLAEQGRITDDMTEMEKEEVLASEKAQQASLAAMEAESKAIQLESSKTGLTKSQLELRNAQEKRRAGQMLDTLGTSVQRNISGDMKTIFKRVDSGQLSQEDAIFELDAKLNQYKSTVAQMSRQAGSEQIGLVLGPIERMVSTAKDRVSGKISREVYENRLSILQSGIKSDVMSRPDMAKLYGVSQILPNVGPQLFTRQQGPIEEYLSSGLSTNTKPPMMFRNDPATAEINKGYLDAVKQTSNEVVRGTVPSDRAEMASEEVLSNNTNILRGLVMYEGAIEDPKELKEVVNYLASPEFGDWSSKKGGVPNEIVDGAKNVLRNKYERELLPAIEQAWRAPSFVGSDLADVQKRIKGGVPTQELIEPVFNGIGVQFRAKVDDPAVKALAQSYNRDIAGPMNQLIRMEAHLNGNKEYDKVWNDVYKPVLMPEEQVTTGTETIPNANAPRGAIAGSVGGSPVPDTQSFVPGETGLDETPTEMPPLEAPVEVGERTVAQPQEETQTAAGEAPRASQAMSDDQLLKQARESLEAQGIDTNSVVGFSRLNDEFQKLKASAASQQASVGQAQAATTGTASVAPNSYAPVSGGQNYVGSGAPLPSNFVNPTSNPNVNPDILKRFEGRRLPVSIRNNNMGAVSITGNIERSWAAKQEGFVGTSPRPKNEGGYYAKYATPEHGVGAASKLLENYGSRGVNSPAKIVRKWSVDKAAHNAYANTLVKYLRAAGFDVDSNTALDLSQPEVRVAILKAKSAHESGLGVPVYVDGVFERGARYDFG